MKNLTEAERAYRRGALQAIIFLQRLIIEIGVTVQTPEECDEFSRDNLIAHVHQALLAGRGSLDPKYLGVYLDSVRTDVLERCKLERLKRERAA